MACWAWYSVVWMQHVTLIPTSKPSMRMEPLFLLHTRMYRSRTRPSQSHIASSKKTLLTKKVCEIVTASRGTGSAESCALVDSTLNVSCRWRICMRNVLMLAGGAIDAYNVDMSIHGCSFTHNSQLASGAVQVMWGRTNITHTQFIGNLAWDEGGALTVRKREKGDPRPSCGVHPLHPLS